MVPSLRTLLVGPDGRFQRRLDALTAVALCALTFGAYAVGAFRVSGGVVIVPGDAALVGLVAAVGVGYRGGGLAVAWLTAFAPLFGFSADWALLGLSSHSLSGKLAFLFDPVGLAVDGTAGVLIGTLGFGAGYLVRRAVARVRGPSDPGPERR